MTSLALHSLSFTYPEGPSVLDGLSLTIARGERVGLLGPNGSGKTTLMQLIVGLLRGRGRIEINGTELTRATQREIRRQVGLVFQDSDDQLFMPSVLDDVMFGPLNEGMAPEAAASVAREALGRVGLEGIEQRSAHHLSGGEKRRVALAGVLAMRPELLLLDEPSLNLDPRARRGLIQLLVKLPVTQLVASHDLDLVWDLCGRVVVLDGGRIVADGPTEAILRDEALLREHGLDLPLSLQRRPAEEDTPHARH